MPLFPRARTILALTFILGSLLAVGRSSAQTPHAGAHDSPGTIPALFLSDIHFDPFHDPAKAQRLSQASAAQWPSILAAPDSPDQPQRFAALQQQCHARGVDTPWPLLRSSFDAMRRDDAQARFLTVSGDLIAHGFTCRYNALIPNATPESYQAFVEKTIRFVVDQLRAAFPGTPIYLALGNNDTACGDYQIDPDSSFLAHTAAIVADALPAADRSAVLAAFPANGAYNVPLASVLATRMIVVNDLFLSPKYRTCAGSPDPAAAAAAMSWLHGQLAAAQRLHQKVWIMAHIPPGVDPYTTVRKIRNVCGDESADMFLSSDALARLLADYAGSIRLALFGHTHMDEIHLIPPASKTAPGVPLKLVASISPVDGNNPSFTIARIDPATATLDDYTVFAASNQTGLNAAWSPEYSFRATYHATAFTAAAVQPIVDGFEADAHARTDASRAYIRNYFVGDRAPELTPFWPQYACSLANPTARSYAACVCASGR